LAISAVLPKKVTSKKHTSSLDSPVFDLYFLLVAMALLAKVGLLDKISNYLRQLY